MRFVPYHEIGDGEVKARVYGATWNTPSSHSLMEQLRTRPDLYAEILSLLKKAG